MLCPDYSNFNDPFVMNNDGTDVKFKRIDIVYDLCNNSTSGGTCFPPAKTLAFLADF